MQMVNGYLSGKLSTIPGGGGGSKLDLLLGE